MKALKLGIRISLLCVMFALPSLAFADDTDPPKDPFYTQGVSKDAPPINTVSEQVDPFSGVLTLHHTDLHLPGNGGLDLNLVRTYNSMIWGRMNNVGVPGLIASNEKSTLGIGWTMHMGIVRNPAGTGSFNQFLPNNPVFELPDGSKQVFYVDKNDPTRFISKDFWVYKRVDSVYEVTSPSGVVYTVECNANAGYSIYEGSTLVSIGQVTKIRNAASTAQITVTYSWGTYYLSRITSIADSANRTVSFNYNTDNLLSSIVVDGRTTSYAFTTIYNQKYLTTVTPPVGDNWTYEYETGNFTYQLNAINFPTGGRISYAYSNVLFNTGAFGASNQVAFRVVTSRTTSGRGIAGGTWTYTYSATALGNPNVTTISCGNCGSGVTETHTFFGWGNTGNGGNVWKVGLPISKSYSGAFSLSESYTWTQGTQISNDKISNANWSGAGGQVCDYLISVPFLASKSVTRDGKTYSTTYNSNYDTYGNPTSISEIGDISRNSTLTYTFYNTAKNIVKGKPTSESVSGGFSGTSSTTFVYDSNSGNVTSTTKDGVTTGYGYDGSGNLSSITDANNHTTTYPAWSYGRVSQATNPIYSVSRVINSNGTIASETNGKSKTTSYLYDTNLRLTRITPPVGNYTNISYPADSSTRTETRGGYSIIYYFDGFGRPSGSSDTKGVTTTINYNAYGAKSSTTSNIGDTVNYDYFGRATQAVHKDSTSISASPAEFMGDHRFG